jgi:hypothetical protein
VTAVDVTIATFNLNLFGRWNLYVAVPETRALPGVEAAAAVEPPRGWLEEAPGLAATRGVETRDAESPDVQIVLEGDLTAGSSGTKSTTATCLKGSAPDPSRIILRRRRVCGAA